jgi:hypothetical protein
VGAADDTGADAEGAAHRGAALLVGGEINSVIARAAAERRDEIAAPLDQPDEAPSRAL